MTTTTFAEYAAAAEARKDIATAVLGHTYALCGALRQNYIDYSIKMHERSLFRDFDDFSVSYHEECIAKLKQGICDYEFYPETGRKYHKIVMNANGSRSVHCFIDKQTGSVLKSASWRSPAKGERCNLLIITEREWAFKNADWAGAWLYRR
jgi:hypothetical protein